MRAVMNTTGESTVDTPEEQADEDSEEGVLGALMGKPDGTFVIRRQDPESDRLVKPATSPSPSRTAAVSIVNMYSTGTEHCRCVEGSRNNARCAYGY